MKKLLFTLFMFISIFSFGVCAYAATISDCDINIESRIMTVTGKLDKACKVGIHVHNSSGELVYMNDTYAGDDSLRFEFKMIISSETSEVYTVKIGGEGANVVEKKAEFIISDKKEFLNFSIAGNRGIINGSNNTIKVTVSVDSLRNLTAEFAVSDMATVWIGDVPQESGVTKNDFDGLYRNSRRWLEKGLHRRGNAQKRKLIIFRRWWRIKRKLEGYSG